MLSIISLDPIGCGSVWVRGCVGLLSGGIVRLLSVGDRREDQLLGCGKSLGDFFRRRLGCNCVEMGVVNEWVHGTAKHDGKRPGAVGWGYAVVECELGAPIRRLAQDGESPSSAFRTICMVLPIARSAKPLA